MAVNLCVARLDWWEAELTLNTSGSVSVGVGGVATLTTLWIPDYLTTSTGFQLRIITTYGGLNGNQTVVTLTIPSLSISLTHTITPASAVTGARVRLEGVRVYQTLTQPWRIEIDRVKLIVGGVTVSDVAGGQVNSGMVPTPASIPILGIMPILDAQGVRDLTFDGPGGTSAVEIGKATASGRYQWQETGKVGTSAPPLLVSVVTPPGSGLLPPVSGGPTTWDGVTIAAESFLIGGGSTAFQGTRGGWVALWPNLPRAIRRMNTDFWMGVVRMGLPKAVALGSYNSYPNWPEPDDPPPPTETQTEILPRHTQLLAWIGEGAHVIEDPLAQELRTPYAIAVNTTDHGPGTRVLSSRSAIYPVTVDTMAANPQMSNGLLNHPDPLVRLWNSWWNPLCSYGSFWANWKVDGADVPYADYWRKIGTQHAEHPGLPPAERTKERNSLLLSGLEQSQLRPTEDLLLAPNASWIGASRWQTREVVVPQEIELSASGAAAWSATGGTLTFGGADITVDAAGSGPQDVVIEVELAAFTFPPYLALTLVKQVNTSWAETNITRVRTILVGIDGTETDLGLLQGWKTVPRGAAVKYAGSWAIDNGAGVVTDTGADAGGDGISAATMADPERSTAFELMTGWGAAKLKLVVSVADAGLPATISYPRFRRPRPGILGPTGITPAQVHAESRQVQTLLWPNAPALRYTNHLWYLPGPGLQVTPLVQGLDYKPTIIDGLCWIRAVLLGVDRLTGGTPDLTTELVQRFDTFEGQGVGQVDNGSLAVILPTTEGDSTVRMALIPTLGEYPPLSAFPRRQRGPTWLEEGPLVLEVWEWAQRGRTVFATESPRITRADDVEVGASVLGLPEGWQGWRYSPSLDGTEAGWKIRVGGAHLGTVRPWHGFLAVPRSPAGGNVALADTAVGVVVGIIWTPTQAEGWVFDFDSLDRRTLMVSTGTITDAAAAFTADGIVVGALARDGRIEIRRSANYTESWSALMDIGPGTRVASACEPRVGGLEYHAVYDTDRWKLYRSADGGASFSMVGDIVVTATAGRADLEVVGDALNRLVFAYDDGTTVRRLVSTNQGDTWTG